MTGPRNDQNPRIPNAGKIAWLNALKRLGILGQKELTVPGAPDQREMIPTQLNDRGRLRSQAFQLARRA